MTNNNYNDNENLLQSNNENTIDINSYNFLPHVSKEFILSKLREVDIFSRYFITPSLKDRFVNPFRDDKNPDCFFYIGKNREIRFKDFSYGYNWSCFDVVMIKYNLTFSKALQKIAVDFNLFNLNTITEQNQENKPNLTQIKNIEAVQQLSKIEIKKRRFNELDIQYWKQFGLIPEDLYYVYPLQNVFINGKITYNYNKLDPAYAYNLGESKYKIYFPKRNKKYTRFLQSGNITQGKRLLPKFIKENNKKFPILIITKSYKDVLVLRKLGYYGIAPSSETTLISEEEMQEYKNLFENIYLFFDNDKAGIENAKRYLNKYNFLKNIVIPENYSKDISDYVKNECNSDITIANDLITYLITNNNGK